MIMKKLLINNKGIALIVLIMSILITALIGAGITAFMTSKKASKDLPTYSQAAYLLADTGVEFAIRYAHDNLDGFRNSPTTYIFPYNNNDNNKCNATSLDIRYWKQVDLPSEFIMKASDNLNNPNPLIYISLEFAPGCLTCSDSCPCTLHSCGRYGAAVREIKLHYFQIYYDR